MKKAGKVIYRRHRQTLKQFAVVSNNIRSKKFWRSRSPTRMPRNVLLVHYSGCKVVFDY